MILEWAIGFLCLVGAIAFIRVALQLRRQSEEFAQHGVSGEAEVISKNTDASRRPQGGRIYLVQFRFDVAGVNDKIASYQQQGIVSGENYERLSPGSKVPIRYLARNPEMTAKLAGIYALDNSTNNAFLFGGTLLVIAILILAFAAASQSSQNQNSETINVTLTAYFNHLTATPAP